LHEALFGDHHPQGRHSPWSWERPLLIEEN